MAIYPHPKNGPPCIFDTIDLIELLLSDLIDCRVMIVLVPEQAARQESRRDAHRSDAVYLDYKNYVTSIYCKPYLDKHRDKMDLIREGNSLYESVAGHAAYQEVM